MENISFIVKEKQGEIKKHMGEDCGKGYDRIGWCLVESSPDIIECEKGMGNDGDTTSSGNCTINYM